MTTGIVTRINPRLKFGTIRAAGSRMFTFTRAAMVLELEFEQLQPGDVVQFEIDGSRRALNVERKRG
jgi:cold shock CspA family protein